MSEEERNAVSLDACMRGQARAKVHVQAFKATASQHVHHDNQHWWAMGPQLGNRAEAEAAVCWEIEETRGCWGRGQGEQRSERAWSECMHT